MAIGVVGDADALGPGVFGVGLGAANALQTKFGNECVLSQELEQTKKKKAVLVSVKLVIRKLLKL
jgi:hypothetical protein